MQNRHFFWILAIFGFFFIADRCCAMLQRQLVVGSQFRYTRLYTGKAQADILLVGNSRGLMFYEPEIERLTGKKTFNLSYNGMPVALTRVLVADYLDRYDAPKHAFIEITHSDRFNTPLIGSFSTYKHLSPRLDSLLSQTNPTLHKGIMVANTVACNNEIFQRALAYRNSLDNNWLLDRVITADLATAADTLQSTIIMQNDTLSRDMSAMVAQLKAAGTEVHLVLSPYFPAYGKKIQNLEIHRFKIAQITGNKVWDYSSFLSERQYFGDLQHVNVAGAKVFIPQMLKDAGLISSIN